MKNLILIYILFLPLIVNGQDKHSFGMSKEQMLNDLSYLQSHIDTYYALLPLHERRTGINMDAEFERFKDEIQYINTNKEFLKVVRKALNLLYDGHASIVNKQRMLSGVYNDNEKLKESDADLADYYFSLSTDSVFSSVKCGIRTKYLDGKYYNVRPFTYKNRYVKPGDEITEINCIPINKFIQNSFRELYYLSWDDSLKQWYDEYFQFLFPCKKFRLKIGNEVIELDNNSTVDNLQKEFMRIDLPKIIVLNGDILYIRIPMMDSSEWYRRELGKYFSFSIKKVILDVRGNPGGSDSVWWDILEFLIDKPFTYQMKLGFNQIDEVLSSSLKIKYYERDEDGNVNSSQIFNPSKNSLHFNGKYYVLRDKDSASSATALSSVAWQNPNMLLVGEPSGPIVGEGFTPYIFTMPNSKITFILSYTIDLSGGKDNPYMNAVEMTVIETKDEYIDKVLHYDSYGVEYLLTKDKMIKAVIND